MRQRSGSAARFPDQRIRDGQHSPARRRSLSFDFANGCHDTGNAMATSIAKALSPRVAGALSAVLNLTGAFLSLSVDSRDQVRPMKPPRY